MARNLELKVDCTEADHDRIIAILAENNAALETLEQTDRYYGVPEGRLKMRWINQTTAELIRYHRPDAAGARLSTYHRIALDPDQAASLDAMLIELFGEQITIRKRRQVGILGQTRVHLDTVEGLGAFVELETLLSESPDAETEGHAEYGNVVKLLGLNRLQPIAGSYSDLLKENA